MERDAFSKEISQLESSQYFTGPIRDVARAIMNTRCGFIGFRFAIFRGSDVLRDKIRTRTINERARWIRAGRHIDETDDSQFKFLVTYYLSANSKINPAKLEALIANAMNPGMNYNPLLNATPDLDVIQDTGANTHLSLRRPIELIARGLIVGVAETRDPTLDPIFEGIKEAVRMARKAHTGREVRQGGDPWSAVFVVSMVRRTAIELGLEGMNGLRHEGVNRLLNAGVGHRHYTLDAFKRMRGTTMGTYHAFPVNLPVSQQHNLRTPQVGDIIVQDRTDPLTYANVVQFNNIEGSLAGGRNLHGDIIVEVRTGSNFVVAIGGNLGGRLPAPRISGTVKQRRYPLDANHHLIAAPGQAYTQEDNQGTLPPIPPPVAVVGAANLQPLSTGRIFTLLSPVEECHTFPC